MAASLTIPGELKKITPFVRRAEELDKDSNNPESRLVAYYCRQYAVHTGIPLAMSSSDAKVCLSQLLESLEKEKPAMDNFTKEEAKYVCTSFANKIFSKANEEDINGLANKNTAKTFYAAASFLQILEQFDAKGEDETVTEESQENKKKMLYAKWKATEILKAIKEGREPTPGGYEQQQEDDDEEKEKEQEHTAAPNDKPTVVTVNDDDDSTGDEDVTLSSAIQPKQPPPVAAKPPPQEDSSDEEQEQGTEIELNEGPPPPAYDPSMMNHDDDTPPLSFSPTDDFSLPPPPSAPLPVPKSTASTASSSSSTKKGIFGFGGKKNNKDKKLTKEQYADAIELTRFALVALEDKNAEIGIERLQQALQVLGR